MKFKQLLKWLNRLVILAGGSAFLATFLGFLGQFWWVFELLDHPRPQYCLILVAATIAGALLQQAWIFVLCLPIALNLLLILPLFFAPSQGNGQDLLDSVATPSLQIVHANLDRNNQNIHQAIGYLSQQKADVIFLQEVTPEWFAELEAKLSGYRVVISQPLNNTQGVAMFVPLDSTSVEVLKTEIIHLPDRSDRPIIEAIVRVSGQEIALLSLHTIRPRSRSTSAYQQREFSAAAQWSQTQLKTGREAIVIGDFNSTPWSGRFRQFLRESSLINSLQGYGLQPTWLAGLPSVLMIPIDGCVHSQSIVTQQRLIGQDIGSDHLPLSVTFRLDS